MKIKDILVILLLLILVVFVGVVAKFRLKKDNYNQPKYGLITDFDECSAAGNIVLESYPAQCRTSDGRSFIQDIGNELEMLEMIHITNPRPGQSVKSPLLIEGEARGNWFFEASFPLEIYDENNNMLGNTTATAVGEWMTTDFVQFKAALEFTIPTELKGYLLLKKDNPSGLPENDGFLKIPLKFEK